MKLLKTGLLSVSLLLTGAVRTSAQEKSRPPADPLIVHEWGTFLTMNGSDGVVLDSMYHEEHALPDFVHALSRDQLHRPESQMKFETPVIYFYTKQPRTLDVTARFPSGIWTHWFPQAAKTNNVLALPGSRLADAASLLHGCLHWHVDLLPPSTANDDLLPRTAADSLWNFARQVDAAYVRTTKENSQENETAQADANKANANDSFGNGRSEVERYLFYRGLGHASLPLEVDARNGGTLSLSGNRVLPLTHLFVMRVEGGRGVFRYIPKLQPGESLAHIVPDMQDAEPLTDFTAHVGDALAARLEESGLYAKEARAMVNTWRSSYFQSEGVRVLYMLPQAWTENFIPLQITPRPDKLVRVMVGRVELLTPAREQDIANAVRLSYDADTARRTNALATLHAQGRYIEPILRRLLHTNSDPTVRANCRQLLLTDWVNELRPSAAPLQAKK